LKKQTPRKAEAGYNDSSAWNGVTTGFDTPYIYNSLIINGAISMPGSKPLLAVGLKGNRRLNSANYSVFARVSAILR